MSGGKDSDAVVTGYWYKVGLHLGFCHGRVSQVNKVYVGDRVAYGDVPMTESQVLPIDNLSLFGGAEREGGLQGDLEILFGDTDQEASEYIKRHLGGDVVPGYRNLMTLLWQGGIVSANNPYPKEWAIEAYRTVLPFGASASYAIIDGKHANPAFIIWECLTNYEWGRGYPSTKIDASNFNSVAATLQSEGFGMSLQWKAQSTIEEFVNIVLNHIAGVLREDPITGQFILKLVREEDPAGSQLIDESSIVSLDRFDRPGWGETVNEVVVTYVDQETYNLTSITIQDVASLAIQGEIISETLDFPGIRDADLAARVAERELAARTVPTLRIELTTNRKSWGVFPGDIFRLTWGPLGVSEMACRCLSVDIGDMDQGYLKIVAAEDTFYMPESSYVKPEPPRWENPNQPPATIEKWKLEEAGYYDIARSKGDTVAENMDLLIGYANALALKPTGDTYNWELWTRSGGTYVKNGNNGYSASMGYLDADLDKVSTQFRTTTYGLSNFASASRLPYCWIGTEKIEVTALAYEGDGLYLITCNRGILDTVPIAHSAGEEFWMPNRASPVPTLEVGAGDHTYNKFLTKSSYGLRDLASEGVKYTPSQYRKDLPYPPANFQVNSVYLPVVLEMEDSLITWARRDRLQTGPFLTQSEADVPPEAGTEHTLRFRNENGPATWTTWKVEDTETSYLLDLAREISFWGLGRFAYQLAIELRAGRQVGASYRYSFTLYNMLLYRVGFGLNYGYGYGGKPNSTGTAGEAVDYRPTRGDSRT